MLSIAGPVAKSSWTTNLPALSLLRGPSPTLLAPESPRCHRHGNNGRNYFRETARASNVHTGTYFCRNELHQRVHQAFQTDRFRRTMANTSARRLVTDLNAHTPIAVSDDGGNHVELGVGETDEP